MTSDDDAATTSTAPTDRAAPAAADDGPRSRPGPAFELRATVLGARDPERLGRFWAQLLGWQLFVDDPTWCRVRPDAGSAGLSVQLEEGHVRPAWPAREGEQQMQMHLDVRVDDVDAAVARALELGATLEDHQPQEDNRVLRDPEGHLFCLFLS